MDAATYDYERTQAADPMPTDYELAELSLLKTCPPAECEPGCPGWEVYGGGDELSVMPCLCGMGRVQ